MFFHLRELEIEDVFQCQDIVQSHWGDKVSVQAVAEMLEMFSKSRWPPHYYVAVDNEDGKILGFAGFKDAWLMTNAFELIWINVRKGLEGLGIGQALTKRRIQEIERRNGSFILLMTQKTKFFEKFGFKTLVNMDGWELMLKQISPISLGDRSL